jgi:hypothetical protein
VLIGREQERGLLLAAVDEACAQRGSIVLLAGEAGVGKTVFARSVLEESGLALHQGAGLQGGAPAYWPLTAALPELSGAGDLDRAALSDRMVSTFAAAAQNGPAAVFLDDLQWADEGTLDMLAVLSPALETQALLVVAAYRSDEMPRGHPLRRLRSELRRQGRLNELAVEPLDAAATRALLRAMMGDEVAPPLLQPPRANRGPAVLRRGARRRARRRRAALPRAAWPRAERWRRIAAARARPRCGSSSEQRASTTTRALR